MATYSAVPKFKMVPIEILDRTKDDNSVITKLFKVYIKGAGCPLPITIEFDDIWEVYRDNIPTDEQKAEMSSGRYYNAIHRAALIVRRDLLCLVTEGLDVEDANVLVSPDPNTGESPGLDILILCGWFDKVEPDTDTENGETPKGEVINGETGEST